MTSNERTAFLCGFMLGSLLTGFALAFGACTSDEATRSLRSVTITHTDSSGNFDSHGGWKTSDDVWRGGMGGDLDVHSWSIGWSPFAYLPDPDASATRTALEQVLRARDQERPKWEAPSESTSPAAPVTPKPEDCGPSQACSEAGAAPVETPARPVLDLPLVESKTTAEPPQPDPAPSKPAPQPVPSWWQDPVTVGTLVTAIVAALGGREWHKRRRRRRAAVRSPSGS